MYNYPMIECTCTWFQGRTITEFVKNHVSSKEHSFHTSMENDVDKYQRKILYQCKTYSSLMWNEIEVTVTNPSVKIYGRYVVSFVFSFAF